MNPNQVTGEDITMFQNMFAKLSNIIVQASELGTKLPTLEAQLAQLSQESEAVRKRNIELDDLLYITRNERDMAKANVTSLSVEKQDMQLRLDAVNRNYTDLQYSLDSTAAMLNECRKDRDDAAFRNLELSEELTKANATIAKFREILGVHVEAPKPDASPTVEQELNKGEPAPIVPKDSMTTSLPTGPVPAPFGEATGEDGSTGAPVEPERIWMKDIIGVHGDDRNFWNHGRNHQWNAAKSDWYYLKSDEH